MISGIIPYLCYRLGMGTLPMISVLAGELIVLGIFGRIVVVPVPFGIGTNAFQEIYDRFKNRPRRDYYLLAANHSITGRLSLRT